MKRIILSVVASVVAAVALISLNGCYADGGAYAVGGAAPVYANPSYGYGASYYATPTYVAPPSYGYGAYRPAYQPAYRPAYRTAPVYVAPRATYHPAVYAAPSHRRWR